MNQLKVAGRPQNALCLTVNLLLLEYFHYFKAKINALQEIL